MKANRALPIATWVLGVLLLTSGCAVRLAYNNADRVARWIANDFVDMSPSQRVAFDAGVAEVWAWHRREHLPHYADFLEALETALLDGTDPEEVAAVFATMIEWAEEVESRLIPVLTGLLATLTEEQAAGLERRLDESNARFARRELGRSPEQIQRTWQREAADRFGRFAGRPTRAQRDYLASQAPRYLPQRALWADYRQRWQTDLLQLLEVRREPDVFAARFAAHVADRDDYYGEAFAHAFAHNQALAAEVTAWLINHMTERQRARLSARLRGLAADFRRLAAGDSDRAGAEDDPCVIVC
jgi:hypothetical protein